MNTEQAIMLGETHATVKHLSKHLEKGEKRFETIEKVLVKYDERMDDQDKWIARIGAGVGGIYLAISAAAIAFINRLFSYLGRRFF